MRLGRLPADLARLAAAERHLFAFTAAPPVVDRSAIDFTPRLFRNDTLPDCSAVALANTARAQGALAGFEPVVIEQKVVDFYGLCVGRAGASDAELEATDGAMLLDVLDRQAVHGFDVGQQVPLVGTAGVVETNRNSLARGIARGAGYWGIDLYERDMEMPAVWDDDGTKPRGSLVGGHAVIGFDYTGLGDADTVRIGTWGAWQASSWRWVASRIREAHAVTWRQLMVAS